MVTTYYRDFEAFACKLSSEVRKHGKDKLGLSHDLQAKCFGFRSPSGAYLVRLEAVRKYAGPVPDDVIIEAVRNRLERAWAGDAQTTN